MLEQNISLKKNNYSFFLVQWNDRRLREFSQQKLIEKFKKPTGVFSIVYMPEHQKPFYPRYHLSGGILCPPADFGSLLKKPQRTYLQLGLLQGSFLFGHFNRKIVGIN